MSGAGLPNTRLFRLTRAYSRERAAGVTPKALRIYRLVQREALRRGLAAMVPPAPKVQP